MTYRRRIIDDALDEHLPHLAAISLDGAKGVGKTATASQRASTFFDLSKAPQQALMAADVEQINGATPPVLIDEWQLVPEVWDAVKRSVDADRTGGRFILAGSAGAPDGVRIHSGAGRIISLRMRPMSLAERGVAEPTVSLQRLFVGDRPRVSGASPLALTDYVEEVVSSGFPELRELPQRTRNLALDGYVTRIVEKELPENGVMVRRPAALRAWLAAYAAATSTDAAYSTILDAATPGESDKPGRTAADTFREHLTRLYVLDPLPAWIPVFNPLSRLTKSPKHHLVDPAIAASLVRTGKDALLRGDGTRIGAGTGTWLGALFESLAVQSIRTYGDVFGATSGHLRTKARGQTPGREVDIILEGEDMQVIPIEVKLASTVDDRDVRHLNWLEKELGDRVVDKVIVTTGEYAYRRPDGVVVVPLALLCP